MASLKIAWTRLALDDLASAYQYISENNRAAARGVLDRIEGAVAMLQQHPHVGRAGRVEGTRELVIPDTPFLIPYRISKTRIELLAVVHGARRWPESFGKKHP